MIILVALVEDDLEGTKTGDREDSSSLGKIGYTRARTLIMGEEERGRIRNTGHVKWM